MNIATIRRRRLNQVQVHHSYVYCSCSYVDPAPVLMYATMGEIRRLELTPNASYTSLVRGQRLVNALDYDYRQNILVFSDVHDDAIFSARLAPRARSTNTVQRILYNTRSNAMLSIDRSIDRFERSRKCSHSERRGVE